jgi:hypothetical protein
VICLPHLRRWWSSLAIYLLKGVHRSHFLASIHGAVGSYHSLRGNV